MIEVTDKTINAFKKMYEINQSLLIKANSKQIKSINESKTRAAYTELDIELSRDMSIYDLQDFISMLHIIKQPILDLSNSKYAIIKSKDGSQELKYYETNPSLITSYFNKEFKLKNEDIKVNIKRNDIKDVMKACNTLSLGYVSLVGDGEKVKLKGYASRKGDGKETNSFTVEVGETDYVFDLIYKSKMLSMIDDDVLFTFAHDEKSKLSKIKCGDMTYFVGIELNSTMEA